ncbi:cell division protein MukB [Bacillus wiedmannii]|uniref:cell division protein MukB n=1 Tax=Bacillus wiedmannii TaxID=1890302 RepID=UPI002E1D3F38|nr:cell division protein MukB [Bacillus wiedmannii]
MNNLFMIISILGGLSSLTLTGVLITSLFVKRLKPRRKKFTIALVTSVILCVVGGALYEISPEDKARMAQEAEAKKVAEAQAKEEKAKAKKEAEVKEKAKAQEQTKKEAEEKKAQEEAQKKEEEAKRKAEQEEADRIKAEEKAKKETEKAEREAQKAAEEDKKAGTKVKIERYDTCNSQGKYCDRGGFHKGAFDTLQLGINSEEVTLKLDRNAEEATIYYMKDKSGNYVELINYYFEGAVYNVNAYFKDGKLYYAERNDKLHKPEERLMLGELE